jgi:hypothetical protein
LDDSEILNRFIDYYINEVDSEGTKTSIHHYQTLKKEDEKEKYDKWKIQYKRKKTEKYDYLKPAIKTITRAFILVVSLYYWNSDEYKFIFNETKFVKAEIIKIKVAHFEQGYYYQKLTFQYEFNSKKYEGQETIGKRVRKRKIGDFIKLKISKDNPEKNKVVGYYYK